MDRPTFMRGPRVELTPVEPADLDLLHRARTEPEMRIPLGIDTVVTKAHVEELYENRIVDNDSRESMMIVVDEEPVGAVTLFDIGDVDAEAGEWLVADARGNGYATEALALMAKHGFDDLRLRRITGRVYENNDRSVRLLERLGFEHEGTTRDARWHDGGYQDCHRYGLLAPEFDPSDVLDDY